MTRKILSSIKMVNVGVGNALRIGETNPRDYHAVNIYPFCIKEISKED